MRAIHCIIAIVVLSTLPSFALGGPPVPSGEPAEVWVRVQNATGLLRDAQAYMPGAQIPREKPMPEGPGLLHFITPITGARTLVVSAPGHFAEVRHLTLEPGANLSVEVSLDVFPSPARTQTLRIVDSLPPKGWPVDFARVMIEWQGPDTTGRERSHFYETQTGPSGIVEFVVPPGGTARYSVDHDYFLLSSGRIVEDDQEVSMEKRPGYVWIRGRAVDSETGAPIPGASVQLWRPFGIGLNALWMTTQSRSHTNEYGEFRLVAMPMLQRLRAESGSAFAAEVTLRIADNATVDIPLLQRPPLNATLGGQAMRDGNPVEGVNVSFVTWRESNRMEGWTHTNATGHFALPVPAGPVKLFISCTERCAHEWRGSPVRIIRVHVHNGLNDLGQVHLSDSPLTKHTLSGRVMSPEGRPIPFTNIHLYDPQHELILATAKSDEMGEFTVPSPREEGAILIVRGPASGENLYDLSKLSGYATASRPAPMGEQTIGDVILTPLASAQALAHVEVQPGEIAAEIVTRLSELTPLLHIVADTVLGDADGDVEEVELERVLMELQHVLPHPRIEIMWNGTPLPLHGETRTLVLSEDGTVEFREHVAIPLRREWLEAEVAVALNRASFVGANLSMHWPSGLKRVDGGPQDGPARHEFEPESSRSSRVLLRAMLSRDGSSLATPSESETTRYLPGFGPVLVLLVCASGCLRRRKSGR